MLSRFLVSFPVPMFVCWSIIHTVGGFINRGSLAVYAYLVVSVIVFVNCFWLLSCPDISFFHAGMEGARIQCPFWICLLGFELGEEWACRNIFRVVYKL